jgi:hypothetical protein
MANITYVFPDDDDPIFSGAFTVSFPINFQPQEDSMAKRLPYEHSPEPEEGEQPWVIHVPLAPADPDDATFVSPKRPPKPSPPKKREGQKED